jgi:hypothetical protein
MPVTLMQLKQLEETGFVVIPDFLDADTLAVAREALADEHPTREAYHADPGRHARYQESQFAGLSLFPYKSWALNRLPVYPDLIDAAERFLCIEDLEIYKIELWAKYSGGIDYDQAHHRDYENHTLCVPSLDGRHRQLTTFLLLPDVGEGDGPTKVIPLDRSDDVPIVPAFQPKGALEDREQAVTGRAGSLLMYRTDVLHRGSAMTGDQTARFVMLIDFQAKGWPWQGRMSWPNYAIKPQMRDALTRMSPRQRDLLNWPAPDSDYWTEQTLRDTGLRYPEMDMSPYGASG